MAKMSCNFLLFLTLHRYVKVDEEPAIRANTTILLGNLANYLSEATCKRVLLNAFTRALKDSFPPARAAGVKVCRMPFRPSNPAFLAEHITSRALSKDARRMWLHAGIAGHCTALQP